jgi:hypothetical protein
MGLQSPLLPLLLRTAQHSSADTLSPKPLRLPLFTEVAAGGGHLEVHILIKSNTHILRHYL